MSLKWGKAEGKGNHRRRKDDHLPEEVQEINSAAQWKTRCEKGRNWTGNRLLGEGRLSLAALNGYNCVCACGLPQAIRVPSPFHTAQ